MYKFFTQFSNSCTKLSIVAHKMSKVANKKKCAIQKNITFFLYFNPDGRSEKTGIPHTTPCLSVASHFKI